MCSPPDAMRILSWGVEGATFVLRLAVRDSACQSQVLHRAQKRGEARFRKRPFGHPNRATGVESSGVGGPASRRFSSDTGRPPPVLRASYIVGTCVLVR